MPDNISLLILDHKCTLPPPPLTLHQRPMRSVILPCPTWTMKYPYKITLSTPPIFSQHIHLTSQRKSLTQLKINYQVTLTELNHITCQSLLQLIYQQKNLHKLLLHPQMSTLPAEITLPVDIPNHSCQKEYRRNPLTLSPNDKTPNIYHHHSLWILLLIPVLYQVPFQVMVHQIHSSIMIHLY